VPISTILFSLFCQVRLVSNEIYNTISGSLGHPR